MSRKQLAVFLALATAACQSGPAESTAIEFAPAPALETATPAAPPATAPTRAPADDIADAPPSGSPAARSYARTAQVEHEWLDRRVGRMLVAIDLSYSFAPDRELESASSVRRHWRRAADRARTILESAELTSEQGLAECETLLCERLTDALFPATDGQRTGRVERVIWRRVLWR
jgi:hypothetical protein